MAKQCNDSNVLCPFYENFGKRNIKCEGVAGSSAIYLSFDGASERDSYKKKHCCNNYLMCELYKILEKKY